MAGRYSVPTTLAPMPAPDEQQPQGRYSVEQPSDAAGAFTSGLAQGASLEWGDELVGLLSEEKKKQYQDWVKRTAEQNPWTHTAGKVAGALATGLIPGAVALRGARAAQGLWGVAKAGAEAGALTGGVEALGESESGDPYEAARKTLIGAGIGGAAGAVLPPVTYGLASGARGAGRMLYDFATTGETAGPSALRKTEEALRRQGTAPEGLSALLTADATPQVQNLHANNPDVLAFILRANQQGQTPAQISANLQMMGQNIHHTQVGRIIAGFDRANPVPRDLIKLSEELAGPEQT